MMIRTKLTGTLGIAASGVAVALAPTVVSAQAAAIEAAVFGGATTSLTCTNSIDGIALPWTPVTCGGNSWNTGNYIPLVGGTGTYTAYAPLSQLAVAGFCAEVDASYPPLNPSLSASCSATSAGDYINIVCGTGFVTSGVGTVSSTNLLNGTTDTLNIDISAVPFVAGVGVLLGVGTDSLTGALGPVTGVVDLTPPLGVSPAPPVCVYNFDLVGAVDFAGAVG